MQKIHVAALPVETRSETFGLHKSCTRSSTAYTVFIPKSDRSNLTGTVNSPTVTFMGYYTVTPSP